MLCLLALTQLASLLYQYATPVIHALCYEQLLLESETGPLVQMSLTASEYQAGLTDDQELRINGELYDIVSQSRSKGAVNLFLRKDDVETKLLAFAKRLGKAIDKSKHHHGTAKLPYQWMFKLYCQDVNEACLPVLAQNPIHVGSPAEPGLPIGQHSSTFRPPAQFM